MKSIALVALVLALPTAGCRQKVPTACEESVDRVLDRALTSDAAEEAPQPILDMKARMGNTLAKLCMDDKWSSDVLTCLDGANDPSAAKGCEARLTPAQQKKLEKSMGEVMGLPIAEKK